MINRMRTFSTRMENDFSVLRHELDFRAGLKTEAIADRQRDGDLTLAGDLHLPVIPDAVLPRKLKKDAGSLVAPFPQGAE